MLLSLMDRKPPSPCQSWVSWEEEDNPDPLEPLDPKDSKAMLESLESPDRQDPLVLVDPLGLVANLVRMVTMEDLASLVREEPQERRVPVDSQEHLDSQE